MPEPTALLAITATVLVAYWAGRLRLGQRLFEWADRRDRGPHEPAWWAAQAIGLTAVAWMVTAHPIRTRANVRSWREARNQQRSPAVTAGRFDPDWANNRKDHDHA